MSTRHVSAASTFAASLCAVAIVAFPLPGLAQGHDHAAGGPKQKTNALVQVVRAATERFKDVNVATSEGYALQFGCVSGPDAGAMGLHFVKFPLVIDGVIDAEHPEIVIYEPTRDGGVRLIGADYLVLADAWNATHSAAPELMGQLFQFFDAPNRFGLPPFYTLHVWAWTDSPTGTFVNWNTNVSCDNFTGPTQ